MASACTASYSAYCTKWKGVKLQGGLRLLPGLAFQEVGRFAFYELASGADVALAIATGENTLERESSILPGRTS
ncbi:MAG TPA: hypothetical protein VF043_11310 [Ktedonobacteraceae bacterium]